MVVVALKVLAGLIILGVGVVLLLFPHRFRDQQVLWWQSERGVWAFRIIGIALTLFALWSIAQFLKL